MLRRNAWFVIVLVALLLTPVLAGCGGATATAVPTVAPTKAVTSAATAVPTKAAATAPAAGPQVGGTVSFALNFEPDTLDPHKSTYTSMQWVMSQVNATLVALDPSTGKVVPYLAESWKASADGLTWDFTLRKGVKFHDGTPLTAADYAWSLNRAIDPATNSALASNLLGPMTKAEALDESTLRVNLKEPFYPLIVNMAQMAYLSPLPRATVEKMGDAYGRSPIGVGPYKFKQWMTGERIVLERNPDYNWRPAFIKGGPYIQSVEFRFVAEYSTSVSGLESGDLDIFRGIDIHQLQQVKDAGTVQIMEGVIAGCNPFLIFNMSKEPFTDIRVRKAFNLAVDRQALIKVLTLGTGVEERGPMSPTMSGYSPDVEKTGYGFDLAAAKQLMKEAGYTAGADGNLQKDGKTIDVTLWASAEDATVKLGELLQEQYKALGVPMKLQTAEVSTHRGAVYSGEFQFTTFGFESPDADILVFGYGGKGVGANIPKITDPTFDQLLLATRSQTDAGKRQEAVNAAVNRMVDQAYIIPLYAMKAFIGVNNRVKGLLYSPYNNEFWFTDAYITK